MSDLSPIFRAVVAEDEPLPRAYLLELLAAHPEIAVVAECRNGLEAARAIAEHRPDVAFLDIEMPKLDGFEVLDIVEQPLAVVFVTAYDSYAVRAFETAAVDYLVKPVSPPRLAAAVARLKDRIHQAGHLVDAARLRREVRQDKPFLERVAIKNGAEVTILDVDDIDYFASEDDYVAVHALGRVHLKHQTMSRLEQLLDPRSFVRIHRTCILNVTRVARVEQETRERFSVYLKDRTELSASQAGMKRLREVLGL